MQKSVGCVDKSRRSTTSATKTVKISARSDVPKVYHSFVCAPGNHSTALKILRQSSYDLHVEKNCLKTDDEISADEVDQEQLLHRIHNVMAARDRKQQTRQFFFGHTSSTTTEDDDIEEVDCASTAANHNVGKIRIKLVKQNYVIQANESTRELTPQQPNPSTSGKMSALKPKVRRVSAVAAEVSMRQQAVLAQPPAKPKGFSFFGPMPVQRPKQQPAIFFSSSSSSAQGSRAPSIVCEDDTNLHSEAKCMRNNNNGVFVDRSTRKRKFLGDLFTCPDEGEQEEGEQEDGDEEEQEDDDTMSDSTANTSSLSMPPRRRVSAGGRSAKSLVSAGKSKKSHSGAESRRRPDSQTSSSQASSSTRAECPVPSSREKESVIDDDGAALITLPQSARNGYMRNGRLKNSVWEEIAEKLAKRAQPFPFNKWRAGNYVPSRQIEVYGGQVKVLRVAQISNFLESRSKNLKKTTHYCNDLCINYDDITTNEANTGVQPWLNILMSGAFYRVYALERFSYITRPRVVFITSCGILLVNEKDVEQHLKRTKSFLPQQLFSFDPTCDPTLIFVPNSDTEVLIPDISNGLCRVPIAVVAQRNMPNFAAAQSAALAIRNDFRFIKGAVLDKSLKNLKISDICMCDCADGRCVPGQCPCTKPQISGFDEMTQEVYNAAGSGSGSSPFYHGRILSKHMYGVFECAPICACRGRCPPTVCADHLMPNLQIFQTKQCGFGVRVLHDVPSGSFVCSYDGVICEEDKFQDNKHYPYTLILDYIEVALNDEEGEKFRQKHAFKQYTMDAEKVGGVARFFNHSCNPNLFVQNVFSGHRDPRFPRLAFITGRCVYAGEELTWNYGYTVGCMGADKVQECFCGAEECSGRLF